MISDAPRPAGTIAGASPRVLPVRSAAERGRHSPGSRQAYEEPLRTAGRYYQGLTDLGGEIAEETRALCSWTEKRAARVHEARVAYDQRHASDQGA